ncbi:MULTISPECIES: hypothetical protein [unclassified Streptomyces]
MSDLLPAPSWLTTYGMWGPVWVGVSLTVTEPPADDGVASVVGGLVFGP